MLSAGGATEPMPISYSIDTQHGVIVEVWVGDVFARDLADYWRGYLQSPEVLALRTTLVDLRQATLLFSGRELEGLIRTIVDPILKGRDWRTAIIVDEPAQFGVTRQYQVFAERYSSDAIFSDRESALRWLTQRHVP
jgi:hypothetical protein